MRDFGLHRVPLSLIEEYDMAPQPTEYLNLMQKLHIDTETLLALAQPPT